MKDIATKHQPKTLPPVEEVDRGSEKIWETISVVLVMAIPIVLALTLW